MDKKFMTALICAFSRAYHSKVNDVKIFDDTVAELLFTKEEENNIKENMVNGIKFFNPKFEGSKEDALRWIVDNNLSPSPLGRAAYTEKKLENLVMKNNVQQYLIFAAGYDTFAYRQKKWAENIEIFEIDHPVSSADKMMRLKRAGIDILNNVNYISADFTTENWINKITSNAKFNRNKISFCSILGLSYYLSKDNFDNFIKSISGIISKGSVIVFDYPDNEADTEKTKKQKALAKGAGENMLAAYSYEEIKEMFIKYDLCVYEHLVSQEITDQYFRSYNEANPEHIMSAFDNVNYCTALKK